MQNVQFIEKGTQGFLLAQLSGCKKAAWGQWRLGLRVRTFHLTLTWLFTSCDPEQVTELFFLASFISAAEWDANIFLTGLLWFTHS